jgi:Zn-dependent protease with chaperone function
MKLVIAIFLIVSSTIGYAKVSVHRLVIIYLDILNTNKIKNAPKLKVSSDKRWNARYNKEEHSIIINQGLLNADEDTIATTLGHELVHAKYGLMSRSTWQTRRENCWLQERVIMHAKGLNGYMTNTLRTIGHTQIVMIGIEN